LIVLDASVVVDLLLWLPPHAGTIAARVRGESPHLGVPHLLDVEVAQVLRRYVLRGEVTSELAGQCLLDLEGLPLVRYPHTPLLRRAFELRENATLYDGVYLALAEALDAVLLTRDGALAGVPGHDARVEVLS
jgi:predicted nucleic acid-binding protein